MKWIDYRKKLGISWDDSEKLKALQQKLSISIRVFCDSIELSLADHLQRALIDYFFVVGHDPIYMNPSDVIEDITEQSSINEVVSRYIVFSNAVSKYVSKQRSKNVVSMLFTSLDSLNISYNYTEDDDGIFIFPKGAPELDEALVSAPLEWLNDYPESRKAWVKALKEYADQTDENASDIADKFRKSLEIFLKEFFHTDKDMNELKRLYGNHLKSQGIPGEVQNGLDRILDCYDKFMNKYAKHHDRTSRKVLEYIMYETGNVMRLLITLKQEETSDAD